MWFYLQTCRGWVKMFQVWKVTSWGIKKKRRKKEVVENFREVAKANKLEDTFSSLESALRHMWNNCGIIALYTVYLY